MVRWQAAWQGIGPRFSTLPALLLTAALHLFLSFAIQHRLLTQTSTTFPNLLRHLRALPCCRQVAPFLRGEWHTNKIGLLAPAEQRIQLAVDAMLGAVPVWFKASAALRLLLLLRLLLATAVCTVQPAQGSCLSEVDWLAALFVSDVVPSTPCTSLELSSLQ
jgi:hypothetical protein